MGDIILSKDIFEDVKIKDYTGRVLSEFSFNPSDANIAERYEEFISSMDDLGKEILEFEKLNESKDTYEKGMERKKIIDAKIHQKIDHLLNAEAAERIFSVMGALSPLPSGDYYFTFILENIAKKIENATGARMKKIEMKIKKHTAKYHR